MSVFKLVPITVPTGDKAPCQLKPIRGEFTKYGGIRSYLDLEPRNGGVEYELWITSRGKQQWYQVEVING